MIQGLEDTAIGMLQLLIGYRGWRIQLWQATSDNRIQGLEETSLGRSQLLIGCRGWRIQLQVGYNC